MAVQTKVFRTSDTPLAAYLLLEGYELQEITYTHKAYFVFMYNEESLVQQVGEFTTGESIGNLSRYLEIYQQLICAIKEKRNGIE